MTTYRRIGLALAALVVLFIAAGIGRSAWRRAQEPKYEGKTASEWLDELSAEGDAAFLNSAIARQEADIAFRNLGATGRRYLVGEYLRFKPPTGIRLGIITWAGNLPNRARPRFLHSPTDRLIVCGTILRSIRPEWAAMTPEVPAAFTSNGEAMLRATRLLGWTGRGASNAALLLMLHPTNSIARYQSIWEQALFALGTNAAAALPALLQKLSSFGSRDSQQTILQLGTADILGRIGAPASDSVPKLENWLTSEADAENRLRLASVILHIDPNQPSAQRIVRDSIQTDPLATLLKLEALDEMHSNGLPNPFLVDLAVSQLTNSADTSDMGAASLLLRHDPYQARKALYSWLDTDDTHQEVRIVEMLLEHDPHDQIAIQHLMARIQSDSFTTQQFQIPYVIPLRHCLPDSPDVVELLKSIQQAPDDEALRNAIRDTLRHIELNGKLKGLRERDAAGGR